MATLRMASLWQDPRTGIWKLRRRVPQRYRAVADQQGGTVKISTGTADRKLAARQTVDVLRQWAELEAEWERRLNVVDLTPAQAQEVTARWAAWIAAGGPLDMGSEDSDVFEPLDLPEEATPERVARMWDRVEQHADEATRLAGIAITADSRPLLLSAMVRAVQAAYLQADLGALGVTGSGKAVRPLDAARVALPAVPDAPPPGAGAAPKVSLTGLYEAWKVVAVVKPRTMAEHDYAVKGVVAFVEHDDAARITRADLARWRDAMKAAGRTNNTWNNRLSLVRRVFLYGVSERRLAADPTEGLRLPKSPQQSPPPYTDAEAAQILLAARLECQIAFNRDPHFASNFDPSGALAWAYPRSA